MHDRRDNFAECCQNQCNQYFPDFIPNFIRDQNTGCKKVLGCHGDGCEIKVDHSGCGVCECHDTTSRPIKLCPILSCRRECNQYGRKKDPFTGCEICKCRQGPHTCPSLHDCFKKKSKGNVLYSQFYILFFKFARMDTGRINTDVKCVNVAVVPHLIVLYVAKMVQLDR